MCRLQKQIAVANIQYFVVKGNFFSFFFGIYPLSPFSSFSPFSFPHHKSSTPKI